MEICLKFFYFDNVANLLHTFIVKYGLNYINFILLLQFVIMTKSK